MGLKHPSLPWTYILCVKLLIKVMVLKPNFKYLITYAGVKLLIKVMGLKQYTCMC